MLLYKVLCLAKKLVGWETLFSSAASVNSRDEIDYSWGI